MGIPGKRGLCWVCYHLPDSRDLFPSVHPQGVYGSLPDDVSVRDRPPPAARTRAAPGSAEKVEVMAARYARGEHLHHPDDLR